MGLSQLTFYFLIVLAISTVLMSVRYINSPDNKLTVEGNPSLFLPIVMGVVFVFWLGGRRIFGGGYVDTANYALEYIRMENPEAVGFSLKSEWLWQYLMVTCKQLGFSPKTFFTIVEAGYIMPVIWAMYKYMPRNTMIAMLFVYSSLFFLPFGVNGIRNGLACNLLILAIAMFFEGRILIGAIIAFACFGIHRSTMLPIAATVFSVFVYRNVKVGITLWVASIFLSLIAGGWFINFFAGLGFDDRMSSYTAEQDMSMFSQAGFRWDFLAYSSLPVAMAYYVCVKREITDNWYNAICMIYLLCNSFWVLVITASYSNRFAYLSWFIYPLVIAYPLIMLPLWHNQDLRTCAILLGYLGITLVMDIYWGVI